MCCIGVLDGGDSGEINRIDHVRNVTSIVALLAQDGYVRYVTRVMHVFALIPRMRSTCYLRESLSMSPAVASRGDNL